MEKTIYDLELHESLKINDEMRLIRVPGGWIYQTVHPDTMLCESVLVPFNNEFQKKEPVQKEIEEPKFNFKTALVELGVEKQIASDWLKVRAKKKSANTETAFKAIKKQILLTTHPANDCIKKAVEKSWSGFEAEWFFNENKNTTSTSSKNVNDKWKKSDT